jgi:xanthine dehydrogenase accessory factor
MDIWKKILEKLENGLDVMLLVVIDNHGSSSGKPGFKMAVCQDGSMYGTIGGGPPEFNLSRMAQEKLGKRERSIFLKHQVHKADAEANRSGLICSGEQWVALYPLTAGDTEHIKQIAGAHNSNESGVIEFSEKGIHFKAGESLHHSHKNPVTSMQEWQYAETTGLSPAIYIFGAGHVGFSLSRLMNQLGFHVRLFDDRQDLALMRDNPYANHKQTVDYKDIVNLVPDGENVYVVIMTFAHKSDEIVLRQLISKKIKYLGMMGSDRKVAQIFKNLAEEGVEANLLEKIDAPVGLPIGSQTAEEIAVSIAAKVIGVKNKV